MLEDSSLVWGKEKFNFREGKDFGMIKFLNELGDLIFPNFFPYSRTLYIVSH